MKAKLISKIKDGHIGGPFTPMHHAATVCRALGLKTGYMKALYEIEFSDPDYYRVQDSDTNTVQCYAYLLVIKARKGDIKDFYVTNGDTIIPIVLIDGDELTYSRYNRQQFFKLPDEKQLIEFLQSIEN